MPEMNSFVPLRTQVALSVPAAAGSLRAVVVIACVLVPASGSVIANAMVPVPSQMPGSQRCFCPSVPKRLMIVPQIAGLTTISSKGQPWAASSSQTAAMSPRPPPPPPYSSGMLMPR